MMKAIRALTGVALVTVAALCCCPAIAATSCPDGKSRIRIKLRTDKYGNETRWKLEQEGRVVANGPSPGWKYQDNSTYRHSRCYPQGQSYTVTVTDTWGDGLCCRYGRGYLDVTVDGRRVARFSRFEHEASATFHIADPDPPPPPPDPPPPPPPPPSDPEMTERDTQWLTAHNVRRQEWHERYGKTYVPLQWSTGLKADAQAYAEELVSRDGCRLEHASQNEQGENLAANWGTGSWGRQPEADKVVGRFVDREADKPYPQNGHLTQALWRATHYLGCGEASGPSGNGMCHIQVCRYVRAGNCNMNAYNDGSPEWWMTPVLADSSRCGVECPPEGCR